jgi:FSR family fosmidomycin resistance protein-like MFS transporter
MILVQFHLWVLVHRYFIQKRHVAFFRFWRKRGLAQSILGGNTGSAIGPLLVAIIVAPYGQSNIIWFVLVGILGMFVLTKIAVWYQNHLNLRASKTINEEETVPFSKRKKNCNRVLLLLYFRNSSICPVCRATLLLLDAQIWTFHSGLAVSFVSVSRFGGRRNSDRRSFGDRFGRKYII